MLSTSDTHKIVIDPRAGLALLPSLGLCVTVKQDREEEGRQNRTSTHACPYLVHGMLCSSRGVSGGASALRRGGLCQECSRRLSLLAAAASWRGAGLVERQGMRVHVQGWSPIWLELEAWVWNLPCHSHRIVSTCWGGLLMMKCGERIGSGCARSGSGPCLAGIAGLTSPRFPAMGVELAA